MKPRITFEGAVFHVIQRAVGEERIFLEDSDRTYFLYLLNDIHKNFGIRCYAYCLMDNHVHILIKDTLAKLSEFMKILFQRYAQFFNLKYKRIGHLFARRFEAKLCLEDSYLLTLSRYIHLNPLKAMMVRDPQEYRWSSYNYYISEYKDKPEFLDSTFILKTISEDLNLARQEYREFIYAGIKNQDGFKYPENFYDMIGDIRKLSELTSNIPPWFKKLTTDLDLLISEKIKDYKHIKDREAKRYLVNQLYKKGLSIKEISELLNCHFSTVFRQVERKDSICV